MWLRSSAMASRPRPTFTSAGNQHGSGFALLLKLATARLWSLRRPLCQPWHQQSSSPLKLLVANMALTCCEDMGCITVCCST